jgi:hypothetical protein
MAAEATNLAVPQTRASMFISTPAKDFFFYFASVSVVLVVWFASTVMHVDSFFILAAVAVTANGPHLVSTWTRVYFDKREWRERPLLIIAMPVAIATVVVTVTLLTGKDLGWVDSISRVLAGAVTRLLPGRDIAVLAALLPGALMSLARAITSGRLFSSIILYWATWHFVAQNWGLMRIYQRKSGEPLSSLPLRLERPILFLFVLWCLLDRIDTGPRILFGTEVFYPPVPHNVVLALLAPLSFLIGVYLWQRLKTRREAYAPAAWLRAGFLLCAFIGFFVPFHFIKTDDTSAFAAAACWHGIQYLGIVRYYHRSAWKSGIHPDAKIISWLSQPGRARLAFYIAALLLLAGSGYLIIFGGTFLTRGTSWNEYTWAGVVWLSFTLSHYWLDGVIWKLRKPELARRVGISQGY